MASRNGYTHTVSLPLETLTYDPRVQRPSRATRVAAIARELDLDALGVIQVSERDDGTRVVIDGWHRCQALRAFGFDPKDKVECYVRKGLTVAEEAKLFVELNNTAKPRFIDNFKVRVEAQDSTAVMIDKIASDLGLCITDQVGHGRITAAAALERVYRGDRVVSTRENPDALRQTLRAITGAWGKQPDALSGAIIHGIGLVVLRYGNKVSIAELSKKLAPYSGGPAGLLGTARATREHRGGSVPRCVAGVTVSIYNKGRRTGKLPDWWSS